jgi:hypothetical protein
MNQKIISSTFFLFFAFVLLFFNFCFSTETSNQIDSNLAREVKITYTYDTARQVTKDWETAFGKRKYPTSNRYHIHTIYRTYRSVKKVKVINDGTILEVQTHECEVFYIPGISIISISSRP